MIKLFRAAVTTTTTTQTKQAKQAYIPSRSLCLCASPHYYAIISCVRHFSATRSCLRDGVVWKKHREAIGKGKDSKSDVLPYRYKPDPIRDINWAEKILSVRIRLFASNPTVRKKVSAMGIPAKLFSTLFSKFHQSIEAGEIERCTPPMILAAYDEEAGAACIDQILLTSFFGYIEPHLPSELLDNFQNLRRLANIRFPAEFFPLARAVQRKIYLHVGPTNSGKTHTALNRLAEAESGIYCGPLRLLAHEIYERMNARGIPCNLLTGEDRRITAVDAPLVSSTVEMATLNKRLDVAVVDEIQLIADRMRGWAWTQALLGLQARELHLCGEASAVPLIKDICASLNEEIEVHEYQRLTPLRLAESGLHENLKLIRPGDAIVTFARKDIFQIKEQVEMTAGLKCAVAYGNLPPETRSEQARLFNDPNSGFDVLVASDAIGMGLNLSIKRIVFETVEKYDGNMMRRIPFPQVKQIAGRAGRFGTGVAEGIVTALNDDDLPYIKRALESPIKNLKVAGLQPSTEMFEVFASQLPNETLSGLFQKFEDLADLDGHYFLCNLRDSKIIADVIQNLTLTLRDRYVFCMAPVATKDPFCMTAISTFATHHANSTPCLLENILTLPSAPPSSPESLRDLESSHKVVMLYMWLSLRLHETFLSDPETVKDIKRKFEDLIEQGLENINSIRRGRRGRSNLKGLESNKQNLNNFRLLESKLVELYKQAGGKGEAELRDKPMKMILDHNSTNKASEEWWIKTNKANRRKNKSI